MYHREQKPEAEVWAATELLVALVKSDPEWRAITVDHGDDRLGAFALGGFPERLTCANYHPADEVGLPHPEIRAFHAGESGGGASLVDVRRIRARHALSHMIRRRDPDDAPEAEVFRAKEEVIEARRAGDDAIEPAVALLGLLMAELPGPWELTRTVRSPSGGLWGLAANVEGEMVLGSHDVEARLLGKEPALLWLPREGQRAVQGFLFDRLGLALRLPDDDQS